VERLDEQRALMNTLAHHLRERMWQSFPTEGAPDQTPAALLLSHAYFAPVRGTTHYENAINMLAPIQLPAGIDPVRATDEDADTAPVDIEQFRQRLEWHRRNLARFETTDYDKRFIRWIANAVVQRKALQLDPRDERALVSYLRNGAFPRAFVAAIIDATHGAAVDVSESELDRARLFGDRPRDSSAVYLAVTTARRGEFGVILLAAREPLLFPPRPKK
jgi:hypothetical protein